MNRSENNYAYKIVTYIHNAKTNIKHGIKEFTFVRSVHFTCE